MKDSQSTDLPYPLENEKFISMEFLETNTCCQYHDLNTANVQGTSINNSYQREFPYFSTFGLISNDLAEIMSNWQTEINLSDTNIADKYKWLRSSDEPQLNLYDGSHSPSFSDPSLYGSLPDQMDAVPSEQNRRNATNTGSCTQRVIFCVHGKPSSCCATQVHTAGSDTDMPPQTITIDTEDHCHKTRYEGINVKARRKLICASVLCVLFMIAETVGGFLSNSLAIATDAAHLLTDFASFMISLFSIWVASRKPTRVFLFGWYRAEVIGALASVITIWVVTGILVYMAIERIINSNYEINSEVMLLTSFFGVVVNLIMGCALHQHSHHSPSASEENTVVQPHHPNENINVRAAFIHVIGDFIQSTGVFIAALLIHFNGEKWYIVDPICTFFFSILVLFTTYNILKDTLLVLMEGMPRGVEYGEVLETLLSIENVVRVHNLRIWALSLDKTALAAHVVINPEVSPDEILKVASRKIHAQYNFFEMTLQIEYFQERMEDCKQCQEP